MRIARHLSSAFVALCVTWPIAACSLGGSTDEAALSGPSDGGAASDDCTLTQGYWKNHASAWPVSSLTLGSVSYDQDELIAILKTPVKGNGLVKLAHQLIADPPAPPGTIGVSVQPMSAPVAEITGAQSGVVVTAVDAAAPQPVIERAAVCPRGARAEINLVDRGACRDERAEAEVANLEATIVVLCVRCKRRDGVILGERVGQVRPRALQAGDASTEAIAGCRHYR